MSVWIAVLFLCGAPDQLGDHSCAFTYARDRATFWWTDTGCYAFADRLNAEMPSEYVTVEGERYVVSASCLIVPDSCLQSDCLDHFEVVQLERFTFPE